MKISPLFMGFVSIALFGVAMRAALWVFFDAQGAPPIFEMTASEIDPLYYQAMTEHFWEYFWYDHVLPPISILRDGLTYAFVPVALHKVFYFVLLAALDSIAAGLIYCALRNLKIWVWLSAGVAVLLSIRLLAWEIWSPGGSWDMLNPVFLALFAWTFTRTLQTQSIKSALFAGLAGLLFISSYQTAIPVVFSSLFLVFLFAPGPKKTRALRIGVALLPPLFMMSFIVLKNGTQHGVYAPSSGAGQNILQNLNLAIVDADERGVLRLGKEVGYPVWWSWCYENAESKNLHPIPRVSAYYGHCNRDKNHNYDYSDLKKHLIENPNARLEELIRLDEKTLLERPWLFSGPIGSRTSRFSAAYGKVSSRMLLDVIKKLPWNYVGRTYMNLEIFVRYGAEFDLHYPTKAALLPPVVNSVSWLLVPVLMVSIIGAFAFSVIVPIWAVGAFFVDRLTKPNAEILVVWSLAVGFGFGALSSVGFHCCENSRHAFNYVPVLMLFSGFFIYLLLGSAQRYISRQRKNDYL